MLASRPERPNVPQRLPPSQSLPRLHVSDSARINHVAFGTYGLPSPVSPPPSATHNLYSDALLAAAVLNPRMCPSALDVTLSPPLPLAELGDPFELLPPPCMELQTPSKGWRADLDDDDGGAFDANGSATPATGLLSPPEDAFLFDSDVALGHELDHPGSPIIVSSDLESAAYEGLRICLDPSEYWESVPFQPEKRVKMEDAKGSPRSPSLPPPPPPPPCRPEPRQHDSLPDPAEDEDQKPDLSAPIDTQAGARPPDNVTPFIWKLVKLLENDLYVPWIQWDEEGRHVLVALNHLRFLAVLGLFFRHSSVKSFVRQLHIYGFRRVPTSRLPDILRSLESTTTSGAPRADAYAAFQHPAFVRAGASHQQRMLALMRPGGGQMSRTSTSTRNTRSRAARTVS